MEREFEPALKLVDGLKVLLGGDGISAERQKLLKAVAAQQHL